MPVVPITKGRGQPRGKTSAPPVPVPEPFALMAAAQMHSENRLAPSAEGPPLGLPPQLGGKEPL